MNASYLCAQNVTKLYTQGKTTIEVLKSITYTFVQGQTYALTGVSGAGKSTLLYLLAGLERPTSGSIYFNKNDISYVSDDEQKKIFLNQSIGLVFQSPYVIKELSVLENIMVPGLIAGFSKNECQEWAKALLGQVGLQFYVNHKPTMLSGGQQQRVALARALFNKPQFLLADEPTGNLDVQTGKEIVNLILSCTKKWRMGVIISSHDVHLTHAMDRTLVIDAGSLCVPKIKEVENVSAQ